MRCTSEKRLDKLCLGVLKTVDAVTKQKLGRHVQRHAIEQVHDVEGLTRPAEQAHHDLRPPLKDLQIADAVLDEHRPDQMPAVGPLPAIGREDAVAQERTPRLMEPLALAKVGKVARQHGLDVLGLPREDVQHAAGEVALDAVGQAGVAWRKMLLK